MRVLPENRLRTLTTFARFILRKLPNVRRPARDDSLLAKVSRMIDRKITLALILAIAVEAAGLFAWAGATGARLNDVELRMSAMLGVGERLARVEAQLEVAAVQLTRIEQKLDTN